MTNLVLRTKNSWKFIISGYFFICLFYTLFFYSLDKSIVNEANNPYRVDYVNYRYIILKNIVYFRYTGSQNNNINQDTQIKHINTIHERHQYMWFTQYGLRPHINFHSFLLYHPTNEGIKPEAHSLQLPFHSLIVSSFTIQHKHNAIPHTK